MVMETAQPSPTSPRRRRASKKVTYNLPTALTRELDRRTRMAGRSKSTLVAEALESYFAEKDRQELAAVYAEAASDPLFRADNEAVLRDFEAGGAKTQRAPAPPPDPSASGGAGAPLVTPTRGTLHDP
jgi:hypothetical protein